MQIAFDTDAADQVLARLSKGIDEVSRISAGKEYSAISGAVSLHPGISQWGASQGAILGSGFGAAQKVVRSLADQTQWLYEAFRASVTALSGQNRFISRGMELVDLGGEVGFEEVSFPTRPDLHAENFSFPTPFHSPKMRLASLVAEISSTNYGQIASASGEWKKMSGRAAQAAGELQKIAAQIQADATGDVFELAAERVAEVAAKLQNFSTHSMTIGTSLDKDMAAMRAMQQQAVVAQTQVMAILPPMARIAAEKAAVASLNASFAATMPTLGPPINNLISSVMEGSKGGGTISTGMDALPATEGTKAKNLQQQATAGAQGAKAASAGAGSPEQVVAQAKNIGTNAANYLGTPSIPGLGGIGSLGTLGGWQGANLPAGLTGGAGYSGAAAGAAGAFPGISRGGSLGVPSYLAGGTGAGKMSGVTGARAGITPGTMGTTAPSSKGFSVPGLGGASVGASTPNSFSGAMPYAGLAGSQHTTGFNTNSLGKGGTAGIGGGRGIGSAGGVGGLGNRLAGGVGAGGPVGGIGGNGLGQAGVRGNAPQPSAAPVAGAGVGRGAAAAGATNAAGGRPAGMIGGAPMGAAAGAANSKTGKVKHVTSVVEHDANVKALLGEPTPVVPGVIGDWVRG